MTVDDIRLNKDVRHALAKKWIKTQALNFNVVSGTLYMRGRLETMREPLTSRGEKERDQFGVGPKFLFTLERELLKIPGVRAIRWDLGAWQKGSTGWMHKGF